MRGQSRPLIFFAKNRRKNHDKEMQKKRDMPLSVLLSEEEDDKLNSLVNIFGMDSRSDTIRKLIVLAYDSSEMYIKEVYK